MKNTRRLMERRGVIPYLWRGLYLDDLNSYVAYTSLHTKGAFTLPLTQRYGTKRPR